MDNVRKKYLPIGTVVILKNGTKKVMISGFCAIPIETQKNMFDYVGCFYPEGFLSNNKAILFNHEQIEKIYHLGLINEEEAKFKKKLNDLIIESNK